MTSDGAGTRAAIWWSFCRRGSTAAGSAFIAASTRSMRFTQWLSRSGIAATARLWYSNASRTAADSGGDNGPAPAIMDQQIAVEKWSATGATAMPRLPHSKACASKPSMLSQNA